MNPGASPKPALVTTRGARRLPRVPLLLLCAAYVLPGLFGRDPWRNADLVAFGQMVAIAEGRTSWWAPALGGVPGDTALLPHWLGAAFIALLSPVLDAAFAARVPFALLLGLTLVAVWYASLHLARTDAAQPLPLAFGGEAAPVDYARAVADGALLALMATLGLLQLGHETTPELLQLFSMSLLLYALAAAPHRSWQPRITALLALPMLAGSGAPAMALAAGLAGSAVCLASRLPAARRLTPWLLGATIVACALAWAFGSWRWRAAGLDAADLLSVARQWLWFMWPTLPLALWTLWRWRGFLSHRHISVPLVAVCVALPTNLLMGGSDRALLLALPGLAMLAAFALPTLKRSASAAIDWFSLFFFTACALTIWVMYVAMHTGVPAKPAANIAKLAPGFEPQFSALALVLAMAGTAAWAALVRWRSGRHREALWKSMVLPAGGVALCWLLLMTLWLPLIDYARSPRPLVQRMAEALPAGACVQAPGASPVVVAALEHFGGWRVDARGQAAADEPACPWLLRVQRQRSDLVTSPPPDPARWELALRVQRPTERDEFSLLYRLRP
jgi:4-amino-4-deoxy-L-arabinose transferase-like glycosyltransferase